MEDVYRNHGCRHYRRGCKIRAPCCDEIFDCRHCHNEAKNALETDAIHRHDVPRHQVKWVSKEHFHCDECGICRTGGKENFFHCHKCGCCYSNLIKGSHHCVERAMHHNCPVCFEFLFDSMKNITILQCGHTIHLKCVKEMELHHRYSCPVCSKSICDMSNIWRKLDEEVASTPMPEMYKNKMVWILCNDCESTCEVQYHIVAYKCLRCSSYNTRQIQGVPAP